MPSVCFLQCADAAVRRVYSGLLSVQTNTELGRDLA